MSNVTFKGFRQVSKDYFDSLTDEEKIGYLWFVRSNINAEEGTYDGDIFLGTRCYGHSGQEVEFLEEHGIRQQGICEESDALQRHGLTGESSRNTNHKWRRLNRITKTIKNQYGTKSI